MSASIITPYTHVLRKKIIGILVEIAPIYATIIRYCQRTKNVCSMSNKGESNCYQKIKFKTENNNINAFFEQSKGLKKVLNLCCSSKVGLNHNRYAWDAEIRRGSKIILFKTKNNRASF